MKIAYINGFNSSHRSFNYLHAKLPEHTIIPLTYNSHQRIEDSLKQLSKQIPKDCAYIVGHSLGGLLSILLAQDNSKLKTVVAISSPFAGSKVANTLRWVPGHPPVLQDITPGSKYVQNAQNKIEAEVLSIISSSGSLPFSNEENDSVLTIASQKALPYGKKAEVKASHFEVLLHEKTVKLIRDFVFSQEEHA